MYFTKHTFYSGRGKSQLSILVDASIWTDKSALVAEARRLDESNLCLIDPKIIDLIKKNDFSFGKEKTHMLVLDQSQDEHELKQHLSQKRTRGHQRGLRDCDLEVLVMLMIQAYREKIPLNHVHYSKKVEEPSKRRFSRDKYLCGLDSSHATPYSITPDLFIREAFDSYHETYLTSDGHNSPFRDMVFQI